MPGAPVPSPATPSPTERCPCLSGNPYGECCGPIHAGSATAPTAERLMRSRFSAFATGNADYLLASWHPSTRPASLVLDPDQRWYRLDILGHDGGGPLDAEGTVEFRAFFRLADSRPADRTAHDQHETSRFRRVGELWFYLDGR